jgi:hypothetical protein
LIEHSMLGICTASPCPVASIRIREVAASITRDQGI